MPSKRFDLIEKILEELVGISEDCHDQPEIQSKLLNVAELVDQLSGEVSKSDMERLKFVKWAREKIHELDDFKKDWQIIAMYRAGEEDKIAENEELLKRATIFQAELIAKKEKEGL